MRMAEKDKKSLVKFLRQLDLLGYQDIEKRNTFITYLSQAQAKEELQNK